METAIKVGVEASPQTASYVQALIESVFRVGFETHMDQETIRVALGVVQKVGSIEGMSISNCTIVGEKTINVEPES